MLLANTEAARLRLLSVLLLRGHCLRAHGRPKRVRFCVNAVGDSRHTGIGAAGHRHQLSEAEALQARRLGLRDGRAYTRRDAAEDKLRHDEK